MKPVLDARPQDVGEARLPEDPGREWYLSNDWFDSFVRHVHQFPGGLTLLRCAGSDACLPMSVNRRGFATELVSFTNYYSPYFDLLDGPPGDRRNELLAIFRENAAFLHSVDVMRLQPMTPDVARDFIQVLSKSGFKVIAQPYSENWYIEPGSWQAMYDSISSKTKNTLRRKRKKLEAEHDLRLALFDSPAGLDAGLNDYHRVYYASWKKNEPFPAFIDDFVKKMAARGKLRLHVLYVDGAPAAAQIWFVENDAAYIFKLAYDSAYSSYSVGTILSYEAMRHAVEDEKLAMIDYLTGDDAYKQEWFDSSRKLYRVEAASKRSAIGALVGIKWALEGRDARSALESDDRT